MKVLLTRRRILAAILVAAGATASGALAELLQPRAIRRPPRVPLATPPGHELPWPDAERILRETRVPTFAEAVYDVTGSAFGARGDGRHDDTSALRRAIETCSKRGGGHVLVPAGEYSTGALHLLSGVDLRLMQGAVLKFNGRVEDYPLVRTRFEGIECVNHSPMVYAYGQTGIALSGGGTLDASGTRTWNVGSDRAGVLEPLVAAGLPPEQRVVPDHGRLRSAFVEPNRCNDVLIQGVTLRGSQFWQLHPTLCRNVTIDSVTTGGTSSGNTDACDVESCDHVVIRDSMLDANDDCIAIKSGRDADGRRVATPSQDIVIYRCRLQGQGGGISLGSEMTGGIRNVYVYDVRAYGTSVLFLLFVKSNTQRGGYARGVHLDSVFANDVRIAWAFAQMDYAGQTGAHPPDFGDWYISQSGGDAMPVALQMTGLPGDPIRGLQITDSAFTGVAHPANLLSQVEDVRFDGVTLNGRSVGRP